MAIPAATADSRAKLHIEEQIIAASIRHGSAGPDGIDVTKLYRDAVVFTFDPGFKSTASCESKITYIDGEIGELLYRGYPIEELAEHGDFIETCYLLLHGELPTAAELRHFRDTITRHTMLHEQWIRFLSGFRRDAHPMAIMTGCVGALSAFYHESTDIKDPAQRLRAAHRMIAKMPTIAALAYKYSLGQPFIYPDNALSFAENFLTMCFSVPCELLISKRRGLSRRSLDTLGGAKYDQLRQLTNISGDDNA